jgi:arginase
MQDSNFSFIEAPIYQGQKHFGVSLGPAFLRQMLLDQGHSFSTYPLAFQQSQLKININAYEELSYSVERELRRKRKVFVAGGDHSLSLGSIQGLLRCNPNLKVIWVDAHGDINTRESSETGAFHGMPLSFLLGADRLEKQYWLENYLKPENLIYFGVRDLDVAEKKFLDENKIIYYTSQQINSGNLACIISEIIEDVKGHEVHLSVDADAFDPVYAPSTGVKVEDGLSFNIVSQLLTEVLKVSKVNSFDFVELNPQIFSTPTDVFKTAQIGINLFSQILKQNNPAKEINYGFNDRQRYSAKPDLFHSSL